MKHTTLIMRCRAILVIPLLALPFMLMSGDAFAELTGAVFTTDIGCSGIDLNIYATKGDVYLNGGPRHGDAAGLPDGNYYVQVTDPNGAPLGTSIGSGNDTPVQVTNGIFNSCYQLSAILIKNSDNTVGYDTTANPGGVYKVWVSQDSSFMPSKSKTDNFKVASDSVVPPQGITTLHVNKFYDANANGIDDDGQPLTGWEVRIQDGIDIYRYTPVDVVVAPDNYIVTESTPLEPNWVQTSPGVPPTPSVNVTVAQDEDKTVTFGNVCVGAGGGHTLGFWSNKNGQNTMTANMSSLLTMLSGLNLRNANGTDFNPGSYTLFRSWLLNATATNMAYMLSAQLAAMELNAATGFVAGGALVYAPQLQTYGITNPLGFISINALMSAANAELGLHGNTTSGAPDASFRPYQEALKNALDDGNNNKNFVQGSACPFSFAPHD